MKLLTWNKEQHPNQNFHPSNVPVPWQPWAWLTSFPSFIHRNWKFPVLSKIFPPPPQNHHPHEAKGWMYNWMVHCQIFWCLPEGWEWGHTHVTPLWADNPGGELCKSVKLLDKSGPRQMMNLTENVLYLLTSEPGILPPPALSALSPQLWVPPVILGGTQKKLKVPPFLGDVDFC